MGGVVGKLHQEGPSVFLDMQGEMIPARAGDESTMQALNPALVFNRFTRGVKNDRHHAGRKLFLHGRLDRSYPCSRFYFLLSFWLSLDRFLICTGWKSWWNDGCNFFLHCLRSFLVHILRSALGGTCARIWQWIGCFYRCRFPNGFGISTESGSWHGKIIPTWRKRFWWWGQASLILIKFGRDWFSHHGHLCRSYRLWPRSWFLFHWFI